MQAFLLKALPTTLRLIAVVQFALGLGFALAPESAAAALGLGPVAPAWAQWLLGMMAARCLGFGYGMWVVARAPLAHRAWLLAMVGVQLVDWLVTWKYVLLGGVTLAQVSTASFLPLLFVLVLGAGLAQRRAVEA